MGREFFHPAGRGGVVIRWGGYKWARTGGRVLWKSTGCLLKKGVGGYKIEGIPCFTTPPPNMCGALPCFCHLFPIDFQDFASEVR